MAAAPPDVAAALRDADPVRAALAPLLPPAGRDPAEPSRLTCVVLDAGRVLEDPVRVLEDPVRALADPVRPAALAAPEPGRSELCVARAALPPPVPGAAAAVAPATPAGSTSQFLNMKNCWPRVHTLVVTQ